MQARPLISDEALHSFILPVVSMTPTGRGRGVQQEMIPHIHTDKPTFYKHPQILVQNSWFLYSGGDMGLEVITASLSVLSKIQMII